MSITKLTTAKISENNICSKSFLKYTLLPKVKIPNKNDIDTIVKNMLIPVTYEIVNQATIFETHFQ